MKTLTTITIISTLFATTLLAGTNNDKFYQVTDKGQFHYSYWTEQGTDNNKDGVKPVTMRTFFLETSKNGLLPEGMSYNAFMKLSVEEKQAIITGSQTDIIAAMENSNKDNIINNNTVATQPTTAPAEVTAPEAMEQKEEAAATTNEQRIELDMTAPWLVKAIITPESLKELPANQKAITFNEENNELPWTVDVVVNNGEQTNAKYIANVVKSSASLSAAK